MNINSIQFSDGNNYRIEATSYKKVALYARVSTVEQAEEGYSIDEQIRVLREMCKREGYEIYQEYVDRGISGKNIKGRPALIELLNDANEKKFDLVLVWKMNRFSRKSLDLLTIVDMLKNKNIGFRSYTERYETESPSGKLQFQMMAAIAEFERANIAENVKMGMLARAREGSWNGGHVLGYDVVSTGTDNRKRKISKLVINEEEAQIVRKIFELYTEGHGYKSIAGQLNREGRKTKRKKSFSINSVKQILDNPLYMGVIRYNVRQDWNEKRRNNINPDPVMKKGTHEPLITQEIWEKTVVIRKSRGGKPNRIHSGEFPLTGILRCPMCGSGMVLSRTTNTRKDGTKRVLEYYACGAWKNKGTTVCRSNGIRTDYADKYVLEKIATVANNDILIKKIMDTINTKQTTNTAPLEKEYKSIKSSLDSIETKKDKMLGLYEEGILQKLELTNRLAHFNKEKEDLENRLASVEQQLDQGVAKGISFDIVKKVMKEFVEAYKQSLTYEQRKRLLHLLIDKITISETRKIDTIQIILNKEVVKHFTTQGRENSLTDEFSRPFSVCIQL
ncbi:recombinase family protein [Planococcus sp. APC 3900]|uniref:recombinase family protein n=1 Tax=Planococcus sp. APC 3900 TaxID=3035191 RepID=UPI0025B4D734|nr:recombinase family protein [Planococcus sp. APC 3900]MDN3436504.1 recombinase family protein [Planococcus sp. APC 3900]